ncbi:MAG: hypothetical protein GY749_36245 [Desulfobacteraceae bacterium]|nr:hypothetical protein [Desulfobacteraceae bacterium]
MKTYEKWEFKLAWKLATQKRCCPPDEILFSPDYEEQVKKHNQLCLSCNEHFSDGQPYISNFFRQHLKPLPKEKISPGQIWSLKSELGGWGPKNRYYDPPLVIVLKESDSMDKAVLVSQIYDDVTFFGPGDILLGKNITGFAESWNLYTLQKTDLEICFGTAADEVIKQVLSERDKDILPVKNTTLLYFFRNLEIEVGYFFSSMAVSSLMNEYESLKDAGVVKSLTPGTPEWFENLSLSFPEAAKELHKLKLAGHTKADEYEYKAAASDSNIEIRVKIDENSSVTLSLNKKGIDTLEGDFKKPESVKIIVDDAVSGDIHLIGIKGKKADSVLKLDAETTRDIWIKNMECINTENLRLIIFY